MCKLWGISAVTGKRVKGDDDYVIKEHLLFCKYTPDFENFSILATVNNDFIVTLMKSLLINRYHPPLNNNKQSLTLSSYDVTYAFQSESTLYSCLNVKELFAGSGCGMWVVRCGF